jgi:hypothetical protein
MKKANLVSEWKEMQVKHSIEIFHCEEYCVNDCASYDFYSPCEFLDCLDYCYCDYSPIEIKQRSEYNFQSLMEFSGENKKAWNYFIAKKDLLL